MAAEKRETSKVATPETKVRIMDSVAGTALEYGMRGFAFQEGAVVMLPAPLAAKWLASGLAMEVHADTPLYDPTHQKGRRLY